MTKDHGPSVKDDEQYEKLCEQGESKENRVMLPAFAYTSSRPALSC